MQSFTRVLILLVLGLGFLAACQADESGAVLVGSEGRWTLRDLRYSEPLLSGDEGNESEPHRLESEPIIYRLPEGASQGPTTWYLIHLHFVIEFSSNTRDGLAYVSAWNNGFASALIQFKVSRENGSIAIERYTTGAFGTEKETIERTSIESRFSNYLGLVAVRPGKNTLTFRLETLGGVKVESVRILDDSAIEVTSKPPPPSFWGQ